MSNDWTPGIILPPDQCTSDIRAKIRSTLAPAHVIALTAWAEARARYVAGEGWVSNPLDAMRDIMDVIDNRACDPKRRWSGGHAGACFAPYQFSCWAPLDGPANYDTVIRQAQQILAGERLNTMLHACLREAETIVARARSWTMPFPETTCHYYSDTLKSPPAWAVGHEPVVHRYGHLFFDGIA